MFKDLVLRNRSYRRFDETKTVDENTLRELVDLARHCAAAANLQPLKYLLSCTPEQNDRIFPYLAWAGYLQEWKGPAAGERPTAYIIILGDTTIVTDFGCDHGIAAQTILLGAVEKGLGGCMIGSIQREKLRASLAIPDPYQILLVLAIGRPKEKIVIEEVESDGNIRYWRDEADVHHVPKRPLEQIIL